MVIHVITYSRLLGVSDVKCRVVFRAVDGGGSVVAVACILSKVNVSILHDVSVADSEPPLGEVRKGISVPLLGQG
jgi:hypothetical protein